METEVIMKLSVTKNGVTPGWKCSVLKFVLKSTG